MASIILASVGQAVGAATGIPFAGQIGGLLGSSLGGSRGGSKSSYEGARLESLAVQTSTYGRMIPIVFGTVRIAGNVIWSLPIKELQTTTTVRSGKGGGGRSQSSSTTTFSYYATLAIAVCEGEVTRVDRVWADSKLLDLSQGTYRVYKGTQDQMPDALIESYQGVGATPAYRGMAYVVIEDFPLGDYGNRIPNFTFEVTRRVSQKDADTAPVESMVTSVMLIPGSGEFVYDTVTEYKIGGTDASGTLIQSGYQTVINQHTPDGRANVEVALDQLQQTFPNLEWVGVVVNWFGTSMDIGTCEIWPSVENQTGVVTTPLSWSVAGLDRASARQIGSDAGKIRYGGTPDDGSILRLLSSIRARGLKIFFYPQMLMDVAGKPWRGNLTGSASNVASFFTKTRGYNAFILYYANLVATRVDAFAIGTEMRDLTKVTGSAGMYPAVAQLVSLAASVKAILGSSVNVTYAADWSEYHHTDGGWHHLDPLWASSSIDMVGIDAYFPLHDNVQTGYDVNALRDGWTSGEGYDWYYTDDTRTVQAPLSPAYAWKNIAYWWENTHTNPNGSTTSWVPESKPIWFTEYGFASVDGCANQPNVFVDSTTSSSAYPRFSRGRVDFMAQRAAITATEMEWASSSMIANKFLWTWDARPYPYFPDLLSVWADGNNWVTGHWVQGKLGASHVAGAVEELMQRAGIGDAQVDSRKVQAILDGFVINDRVTARAAIDQLMRAYFFTIRESGAALVLLPKDTTVDVTVDVASCVPKKIGEQEVAYILERKEDLVLPQRMEVQFLNRLQRYESNVQSAARATEDATDTVTRRFSLVLSQAHARAIAEIMLSDVWAERSSITLQLPIAYAALEAGDLLELQDEEVTHRIRVAKVQIGKPGLLRISGVIDSAEVSDRYIPPVVGSDGSSVTPNPVTKMEVLDIPALPTDAQDALTLRFAACGLTPGWTGATVTQVVLGGDDPVLLTLSQPAIMGVAVTVLAAGDTHRLDNVTTVDVSLLGDGALENVALAALLNGANAAVIGGEIIQFQTVTLLSPGVYRLSQLLRGRMGTEAYVSGHVLHERFVLLNDAVVPLAFPLSNAGQTHIFQTTTYGDLLGTGNTQSCSIEANSLKPLSPVKLRASRDSSGDVTIRWIRRTRIDGGLKDYVDVPLREESELYEVKIYSGSTVLRSWRVTTPVIVYSSANQLSDFGTSPTSLTIAVAQVSALVGLGFVTQETMAL